MDLKITLHDHIVPVLAACYFDTHTLGQLGPFLARIRKAAILDAEHCRVLFKTGFLSSIIGSNSCLLGLSLYQGRNCATAPTSVCAKTVARIVCTAYKEDRSPQASPKLAIF